MIKKLVLAAALSLLSSGAFAACTNPLAIKDGSGAAVSMSVSTNADGFCAYNFNLAQINGVAPLMGNGATGTGSPRVTIASDNTPFTVNLGTIGSAATAAAQTTAQTSLSAIAASTASIDTKASAPLPAQSVRTVNIGEVDIDFSRMASAPINVSTITTTQIVPLSGSTKVYVTSYDVIAGGTGNITFVYGTGSSCGTGTTSLTGAYNLTAQAGIAKGSGAAPVLVVPAGNALCVTTSAAVQMSGSVSYQQF